MKYPASSERRGAVRRASPRGVGCFMRLRAVGDRAVADHVARVPGAGGARAKPPPPARISASGPARPGRQVRSAKPGSRRRPGRAYWPLSLIAGDPATNSVSPTGRISTGRRPVIGGTRGTPWHDVVPGVEMAGARAAGSGDRALPQMMVRVDESAARAEDRLGRRMRATLAARILVPGRDPRGCSARVTDSDLRAALVINTHHHLWSARSPLLLHELLADSTPAQRRGHGVLECHAMYRAAAGRDAPVGETNSSRDRGDERERPVRRRGSPRILASPISPWATGSSRSWKR